MRGKELIAIIGSFAALAVCLVVSMLVVMRCSLEATPHASAVDLHVVDDNTAFVLWVDYDLRRPSTKAWLTRVDGSGRTLWRRAVPKPSSAGHVLRVGTDVVAVRYSHSEHGEDLDHAMIAFDFDGKQLWDQRIAPYYSQQTEHRPTMPQVIGGQTVGAHFIEWANTNNEAQLIAVSQRSGALSKIVSIPQFPLTLYSFAVRGLWFFEERDAVERDQDPTRDVSRVYTMDLTDGAFHNTSVSGRGCRVDAAYLTVTLRDGRRSLVSFPNADLGDPHVLNDHFDPLGDGRPFSIRSCGWYRDELVFLVEGSRDGAPQAVVVVTDRHGQPRRALPFVFDSFAGPGGMLPNQFGEVAPLSGALTRFVPVLMLDRTRWRIDLYVLDLDTLSIPKWLTESGTHTRGVFRRGERWIVSEALPGGLATVATIDGATGKLATIIRATAGQRASFDGPVLPTHTGSKTIWLMTSAEARIDDPPLVILDTATLEPVRPSPHVTITPLDAMP